VIDERRVMRIERRLDELEQVGEEFFHLRDGDTTPSVGGVRRVRTQNTSPTTITALDEGKQGQTVTIFFDDANTTIDFTGTTLKGNGGANWSPGDGDFMVCTLGDDGNWRCQVTEV